MRFDFSEEQRMLAESVRRALSALPPTSVPASGTAEQVQPDFDAVGRALADVGLFGLMAPEEQGGLGLGMVDAVAAAIETGRAAVPFPAIETMVAARLAAGLKPEVAEALIAGEAAATAPISGALQAGEGGRPTISGTISLPFADRARYVVAPVETASGGKALLAEVNGDMGRRTEGIDLTYTLNRVAFSRDVSANELIDARADEMLAILAAAELVGAAEFCLQKTVSYLKERQQFGKVIGTFQGLKHMAANCQMNLAGMKAAVEYAAAMQDRAAQSGDTADAEQATTACRIAKAFASEQGLEIARQCVQMHGGIAFTWEYGLHIHFRRITRLANSHGTAYENREALAETAFAGSVSYGGLAPEARLS